MNWLQLITAIVGSSVLTALVTGLFNVITIKETNKENERQRRFDSDSKTVHENKLKEERSEIQKAENLYKIILPATKCEALKTYIKESGQFHIDAWQVLYEALCCDNDNQDLYINYSRYKNWLESCHYDLMNKNNLPFKQYVADLIKNDLEMQHNLTEFFQRYNKGTRENIEIDVEKLNNDIDFINKELNLYIEKF